MKKIELIIEMKKDDGFEEKIYVELIRKALSEIGDIKMTYSTVQNGYEFSVNVESTLDSHSSENLHRIVLGSFAEVHQTYQKMKIYGINVKQI